MFKTFDTEFEAIVREYFEKVSDSQNKEYHEDAIDLNLAKAFRTYILSKLDKKYQFSTPLFAWWDLTAACNFRCVHCLYNATEYSRNNELTPEEALIVAEELTEGFGIVQIVLTGGEIFLRKDIVDIVKKLKEHNVAIKLLTNGALITDEQIKQLSQLLNPYTDTFQISLDGVTKETFAKIRQTDTFEKVVSNIKKIIQHNMKVDVVAVVNTLNYYEICDIYKLCINLGVDRFYASRMKKYNDSHDWLMISEKDLFKLSLKLFEIENKSAKTQLNASFFSTIEMLSIPEVAKVLTEEKYKNIYRMPFVPQTRTCNAHDRISIRADGRVYMCMRAESCQQALLGNCKKQSLLNIWQTRHSNIFFQPRMLENMVCKNCPHNDICISGCLVEAYENFKDTNMPAMKCVFMQNTDS